MKRKTLTITLIPILLITGVLAIFSFNETSKPAINIAMADKHRGVCWVGGPQVVTEDQLAALAAKNVNWISQTPFGWQRGHDNPEIGTNKNSENTWWGEKDEGLKIITRHARKHGIKTILKPHIWLRDDGGKWRGEIKMKSEEDWQKWFSDYTSFMLRYARVAEEAQMEMFCIGTELHQTCVEREGDWRILIAKIREIYSGPLTYAANFSDEYQDVAFWDALDYVGVQAYFPLTDKENPTVDDLRAGWQGPMEELRKFSDKVGKPILFTEVGYKSTKDSGIEPWIWPKRTNRQERKALYSAETQANLYEALFEEVLDQPWMAGVHLWKWFPNYEENMARRMGEKPHYSIDFTPQNKLAEKVMADWFGRMAR